MEANGEGSHTSALSHTPVLQLEIVEWLQCHRGGRFVDCTLGPGGLASHILHASGPQGCLVGIDRDEQAIAEARERLKPFGDRVRLIHGNFRDVKRHLSAIGISEVNGIVFDLGVSSAQLNQVERGFSFMADGPLDMRMDRSGGSTAADLLHHRPEQELADLIFQYGEERYARRIARAIVQARARRPLQTTLELAAVIREVVPRSYRHGRIHYATRTFQALRIAVNQELDALEPAFREAIDVLAPGGRLCIVSFHSLEDRIAKRTLRALSGGVEPRVSVMTKKPIVPSEAERRSNPRARSAKLRVAERLPLKGAA